MKASRTGALAFLLLVLLSACATSGHPAAGTGGPPGQLTIAEARQAFTAFLPGFTGLAQDYSAAAAQGLTTGAELQAQLFFKGTSGPPITKLADEAFYVPRQTGYPRWFWVAGQQGGSRAAGHLFVMVQSARSAPWKTAAALYDLDFTAGMAHYLAVSVARDSGGYATAVPPGGPALDVSPSALPATYASYLDQAAPPAVGRLFQPGTNTTKYIAYDNEVFRGAGAYGWRDTDHQAAAGLPGYALRLKTGGAVVIFFTDDALGWVALSSSAALPANPTGNELNFVPAPLVTQGLGVRSVRAGTTLTVIAVDRVLAFVQPRGNGSINVLINNGAATGLRKSGPG